ncbi:hypothetical protein HK097_004187 [Rhizophlyctis rosea]|uniref:Nuclear-export cofactor Arc1-like N-terminal domain-containing protein n=1 Tax=Rhizophlyctis rosea TaxID=64517 RepID=A0AAD5SHD1_9FUNG|nr:hypothetical protein HK097_004187 [Rhizophlyctis rosea]
MTAAATSTVKHPKGDVAVAVVASLLSQELEKQGVRVETRQQVADPKVAPEATLPSGETVSGPATVSEYLIKASGGHADWLGASDIEKAEVQQWTLYSATGLAQDLAKEDEAAVTAALKSLNDHLATRTFFASNHLTLADLSIYATIYHSFAKLQRASRLSLANLTRFFDLVQHLVHELTPTSPLSLLPIDLEAPPEAKPVEEKKDKKAASADAPADGKKAKADKGGEKKKDEKPGGKEEKKAEGGKKESKSKEKKGKSAEALLNEAPAGVEKTAEISDLEKTIKEKGDLVKKLKTEGGDFAPALADLIAAKKKLTEVVNAALKK